MRAETRRKKEIRCAADRRRAGGHDEGEEERGRASEPEQAEGGLAPEQDPRVPGQRRRHSQRWTLTAHVPRHSAQQAGAATIQRPTSNQRRSSLASITPWFMLQRPALLDTQSCAIVHVERASAAAPARRYHMPTSSQDSCILIRLHLFSVPREQTPLPEQQTVPSSEISACVYRENRTNVLEHRHDRPFPVVRLREHQRPRPVENLHHVHSVSQNRV